MYIETPRMIIRSFTPEDVADLHDILGDDEPWRTANPHTISKKRKYSFPPSA